jgi:hypothetical protein
MLYIFYIGGIYNINVIYTIVMPYVDQYQNQLKLKLDEL